MSDERIDRTLPPSAAAGVRLRLWVVFRMLLPAILVSLACLAAGQVHFLLFHTLAEFFSIIIALTALVVATTSRLFTRNHFTVYVSVVIGWSAGIDLLHTVSYKGMDLLLPQDVDLATQFWIAARFIQAAALLASPLMLSRSVRIGYLHAFFGLLATGVSAWVLSGTFPEVYVEGQGLTPFKVYAEYVIIAMLAVTAWGYVRHRHLMSTTLFWCMLTALLVMILSEFAFTRYVNLYGAANEVGHVLKIFAYWFVYLALVQSTLREPFSMLSRTARTYDAVPDPALVLGQDGLIRQANLAAATAVGKPVEALIGQSLHSLFHAPLSVAQCPVCSRLNRGESRFTVEIDRGPGRGVVECTVAPFAGGDRDLSYVQVVRDITERKRLLAEREQLVNDLGERIKELRCQYAIAQELAQPGVDVDTLLQAVARILPSGFVFPELARACVQRNGQSFGSSDWERARHVLSAELYCNGSNIGTLRVFYTDALTSTSAPFLPEERTLLRSVAQRLGEAIERIQGSQQVQRLTYLYDMLSATNRAIVRCHTEEELLARVFDALIQHSSFPILFIATTPNGQLPMALAHCHGVDIAQMDSLNAVLNDPVSLPGRSIESLRQGKVVCAHFDQGGIHAQWHDYLGTQGIGERAIVPLQREEQLVGIVVLYGSGFGSFDTAQLNLLNEMAADLEFAFNGIAQRQRRELAEQRAEMSEFRFQEIFQASPSPMQIQSVSTGNLRAINRAHQQWLGYTLEDIGTSERWFTKAYSDPQVRQTLQQSWAVAVAESRRTGQPVHSPELVLSCKDGRQRIAMGTMTLIGDDAIVAWVDLTEIRHSEASLRSSEAHFRSMIEQTVMGIYVSRDDQIIYANPRYCEMVGWSLPELQAHKIWHFTSADPVNVETIHHAMHRLAAGERNVHYSVPLICKSGQEIELALHAAQIQWDDAPATIVTAEDITERKRAEQQIAQYVKELEDSMQGTLQAVSNMIDLRDPYTAGHERRVGLIAAAIGRELGWSEERCHRLQLTGLVHDIGKIAVPAEILSKPGMLSAVEMQLIRVHAEAGYQILKDVPFPFPVADIIRQHHERLDGSGYPQGLVGDAILPEARVLAVADVIESISTHRPYRPARGLDVALAELEKGRGTLFDPAVVDAFSRLLNDKGYTLPQ